MSYRTILLAMDIEADNAAVVDYAFSFADKAGAIVHALYACPMSIGSGAAGHDFYAALRERAKTELENVVAGHRGHSSMGKCLVDTNEPIDAVLRTATALCADLIILSTHARHGVERLAVGSVAEGVLEEAKVPVVVVRSTR